ncbi:vomeronasal type-2 receptor 26-like [Hyperolius riggenbachi]|uniref:vomeronasal type-2 receptor 26-like n=1 Tax=Hyperolius riggenbachi TaxID=752182 RepID=UPI0035A2CF45
MDISYETSPLSRDTIRYKSLFTTAQNDHLRFEAIVYSLKQFHWNWVGIIIRIDDNTEQELRELTKELTRNEICIEFVYKLNSIDTNSRVNFKQTLENEKYTAKVVIICGKSEVDFTFTALRTASTYNITYILHEIFLESETGIVEVFNCSLIYSTMEREIPDLKMFFRKVNRCTHPEDPILLDIFMSYFRSIDKNEKHSFQKVFDINKENYHYCISPLDTELFDINYNYASFFSITLAVVSMAHALHEMQKLGRSRDRRYKAQVPVSRCNDRCLPGFRVAPGNSHHVCCYKCLPCSEGEISNITDSENCQKCPDEEWPNEKKTSCIPKTFEYLSFEEDYLTLIFSVVSLLGITITAIVLKVFISYRDTPVVKANNRTVSIILLASILLSFLSVFLFLGRPVDVTCMMRQTSFGIIFSVSVSCVLSKTITVCIAFKATKPGSPWKKWIGPNLSPYVIFICSSLQILICIIWLSVSPPFQEYDMFSSPGVIIIQCNEGSVIGFYSVLGYMGFLAAVSFLLAFMVRTLPDSFNEAKYITFSMLVFCSVWIAMIPAYVSTRGKYMVAVEVFAILTSSAGVLGCIFLPKLYIILLKPELNTRQFSK